MSSSKPQTRDDSQRSNPLVKFANRASQSSNPLLKYTGRASQRSSASVPNGQSGSRSSDANVAGSNRNHISAASKSANTQNNTPATKSGANFNLQSFRGPAVSSPGILTGLNRGTSFTSNSNTDLSAGFGASTAGNTTSGVAFCTTPPAGQADDQFIRIADYKICSVGKAFRQNIRRHVIRFYGPQDKVIDPSGSDFTPPVKIQRRDVMKAILESDKGTNIDAHSDIDANCGANIFGETENRDQSFDAKKVAPHGGALTGKRPGYRQKTRQIFHDDPEETRLRQEEKFPWVMEDFDGRQQWLGHMEGSQSSTYMILIFTVDGFKAVRCDRFYRFTQRNAYQTLSIDEVEEKMTNRNTIPRWLMKTHRRENNGGILGPHDTMRPKMRTGMEWSTGIKSQERDSEDELDFMEDFADDEETPYIEGNDEDNKELETRIKKEMLSANALGEVTDDIDDAEFGKREVTKQGKKLQRYLMKLEKNQAYESSDESEDPYISEAHDTDSDEEFLMKMESIKKEEESAQVTPSVTSHMTIEAPSFAPLQIGSLQPEPASETPTTSRRNSPSPPPSLREISRQDHYALVKQSRPHLVTLKIRSAQLELFRVQFPQSRPAAPGDVAASIKRGRDIESEAESHKKIKLRIPNPLQSGSKSFVSGAKDSPTGLTSGGLVEFESNLITEEEVTRLITRQKLTTIELLRQLNDKFKKDKQNKERITVILRKVARIENGFLIPRN